MNLPEIIVPIVTPCLPDGTFSKEEFGIICSDLFSAGCTGFFVGSSTGRGPWFTLKQRSEICTIAKNHLDSSAVIAAGCMAAGLPAMLENARAMKDSGADIAVITAPVYYDYSNEELEAMFMTFADLSPLPTVLYDIPSFARVKLNRDMILRLARHGNIIGLKDSTGDDERFYKMLKDESGNDSFRFYQGKERFLKESISRGAGGFVVSMIQLYPRLFTDLYRAAADGDLVTAEDLQNTINTIMDIVEVSFARRPETSTLFHILEQVLQRRGIRINITLKHEGACPPWLADFAEILYSIASGDK
jgi:dihydrodipicolinate synthase/N-acetylneuraminate lyase